MKRSTLLPVFTILSISLLHLGCKKDPPIVPPIDPPVYKQSIFLSVTDSGLTEIFLKLTITDTLPPRGFAIMRNNTQILSGSLFAKETTLVDTTAQLNTSYSYRALRLDNAVHKDSSNIVTTKTLDTTSHEYAWQSFTFGEASSSEFNDVAIISENNIWAVGQIYLNDSTGQIDLKPYTIVHWNGEKWEFKKLFDSGNQLIPEIRGIIAFNPSNIWLADGGVYQWDGQSQNVNISFSRISLIGGVENGQSVNKLWGHTSNDIFGVGWKGMITHYNGSNWQKIETGTALPLFDIKESKNRITGEEEILCIASDPNIARDKTIFKILNNVATEIQTKGLPLSISSAWFLAGELYYVCGDGLFTTKNINTSWQRVTSFPNYYSDAIVGTKQNNIVVVGAYGLLSHFNGMTWKHYMNNELPMINGQYSQVSVTEKKIVAVGYENNKAIITIGTQK